MKSFSFKLLLLTLLCGLLTEAAAWYRPDWDMSLTFLSILYYFALTLVVFYMTERVLKANMKSFMRNYFGSIGLRLFLSLGILITYLLNTPQKNLPFLISFLLLHIFFTVFEVYQIMITLRPENES